MEQRRTRPRNNGAVVALCLTFVGGMTGMSFAAVPLYRLFCQVTGYNGTTKRVDQMSDVVLDRTMKVGFDANTSAGLPWDFKPVKREIELKIGETVQVEFTARNMSSDTTRGQAVFNVTPMAAAAYFNKVECFCFTETTLKPGETLSMPVVFFIDPDITRQVETKGIGNITLSYTFYEHTAPQPVALKTTDGPKENDRL